MTAEDVFSYAMYAYVVGIPIIAAILHFVSTKDGGRSVLLMDHTPPVVMLWPCAVLGMIAVFVWILVGECLSWIAKLVLRHDGPES